MAAFNPYANYSNRTSNTANQTSGNGYNRNNPGNVAPTAQGAIRPLPLPSNYVDAADDVVRTIKANQGRFDKAITTSKLRSLFGLFADTFNEVKRTGAEKLTDDQVQQLLTARVRIVYESGRDQETKNFINQSKMLEYLLDIGNDASKLVKYYHYLEALVAYHRFYFGELKDR